MHKISLNQPQGRGFKERYFTVPLQLGGDLGRQENMGLREWGWDVGSVSGCATHHRSQSLPL